MMERVEQRNPDQTELLLLTAYTDCLAKAAPMFHRQFVDEFFRKFIDSVQKALLESSREQLRVTKKEKFDEFAESVYKKLLPRVGQAPSAQGLLDKLVFSIDLGMHFLSQTFFDKRIDGIKTIGEAALLCASQLRTTASGATTFSITTDEAKLATASTIVAKLMKDNFIMAELFSKDKTHSQLLQRSEKVLKLLFMMNAFDESHRDILWKQVLTNDEDAKVEMLKALTGAADEMQEIDKLFFLEKIQTIPYEDINERHIQLVTEIGTVRQTAGQEKVREQVLGFLWRVTFESDSKCQLSIVNRSSLAFSAAIKGLSFDKQLGFIDRLVVNLQENRQAYLVIKTLQGLLKGSCDPPVKNDEFKTLADVVSHLEAKYGLLETVFANFEWYMRRVEEGLEQAKAEVTESKLETAVFTDLFMHSDQITLRLEFIRFYATSSPLIKLQTSHLEKLWDLLIVSSPVEKDEKQIYKWLREVTDQVERLSRENVQPVVSTSHMIDFYHSRIAADSDTSSDKYKLLSLEGYQCRQSFFVLINQIEGKVRRVTWESGVYKAATATSGSATTSTATGADYKQQATKTFTSYNSQTGASYSSYSFNTEQASTRPIGPVNKPDLATESAVKKDKDEDPEDLEVESLVPPNELDGLNMIWRIATESTSKNVIDSAGKLLISLHHGVAADLRDRIPDFDDIFIDRIFQIIEEQIPLIKARSPEDRDQFQAALAGLSAYASTIQQLRVTPPEERKIVRSLFLLRQMIRASEKDGTHGLRPHSALSRGTLLTAIQVSNSINQSQGFRSRFEIAMDSNATVWELKRRIGEEVMKTSRDEGKTWAIHPKEGETEPLKPFHPAYIRLFQMQGAKDIQDLNHGSTLSELNFKNNETLGAFKKSIKITQRKALIVEDDAETGQPRLTPCAEQIAEEIFNRYAIEGENGEKGLGLEQLIQYTIDCTNTACDAKDHRVVNFMAKYDPEQRGFVNLEAIQKFYLDSVVAGSELTLRNNFENLGYGPNLKRLPDQGDDPNQQQVRRSAAQMPRFKVSQNQNQFNLLMSLLDLDGEVSKRATEAINMHATNPVLFEKVKSIENLSTDEAFDWDSLFDGSNVHQMLYTLEIIEAMLMGDGDSSFMTNWIKNFIGIGGLQQLQTRLTNALDNTCMHHSHAYKKYVEQLLKLVRIFVTATTANKEEQPPVQD